MSAAVIALPVTYPKAEWVRRYHACSWRAFLVKPNGKSPLSRGWQSRTDAETLADLAVHPDANIGVVPPSGSFVLDADGPATLQAYEIEYGKLPETLTATTRSGGKHLVFSHPDADNLPNAVKFAPGLDVRVSGKGLIVVEPSTIDARPYKWENWGTKTAVAPDWLISAIKAGNTPENVYTEAHTRRPFS